MSPGATRGKRPAPNTVHALELAHGALRSAWFAARRDAEANAHDLTVLLVVTDAVEQLLETWKALPGPLLEAALTPVEGSPAGQVRPVELPVGDDGSAPAPAGERGPDGDERRILEGGPDDQRRDPEDQGGERHPERRR